ncbi:MAG: polysaccharide biosynthesis C-terminal domain-containing protein [Butyricicoccus sp.]|nr:polysaccharide biosynthesis C-terminal domain-containing protein [Butyricicoccus sp.]
MAKQLDLLRDAPRSLYIKYLTPSISASLVTSIYLLADTIMIGRGCGAEALAALNLVLPLFAMLFACGMLFGVGGGVLYSVARGSGDEQRAQHVWSTAVLLATAAAIVLTVFGFACFRPLCYALGADDTNLAMVMKYAIFVVAGAPVFVFSTFLQAFVRNDRDPKRAMAAVLSGSAVNIVFDYIFIFPMKLGLTGGAAATVMGNTLTVFVLLTHLRTPQNGLHFSRRAVQLRAAGEIVAAGAPSFFIEAATGLITFTFNRQILRYLGHLGVVAYGVVANYALVMQSLFNGTGQAAQPIMAANYGAEQPARVRAVQRMGLVTVLVFGALAVACSVLLPVSMTALFVELSDALLALSIPAIRMYFPAFVPLGINLFLTTYLQAVVRPGPALVIMILRGVALPVAFAVVLPVLFGGQAIFAAVLCAEVITCAAAIVLTIWSTKKGG